MGLLSSVNLGVARAWPWLKALRSNMQRPSILAELQHADNAPIHPLWTYLPREQRSRKALFQLRLRRIWAWLKQKRQRIGLVVILYLLIWSTTMSDLPTKSSRDFSRSILAEKALTDLC